MNKAQTKQVRIAKKAVSRTNNLKSKTNLKQGYHESRQQIWPNSNKGKLNKAEQNLETRGKSEQNLGSSCSLGPINYNLKT